MWSFETLKGLHLPNTSRQSIFEDRGEPAFGVTPPYFNDQAQHSSVLLHDQPTALLGAEIERPHGRGFGRFPARCFHVPEHLRLFCGSATRQERAGALLLIAFARYTGTRTPRHAGCISDRCRRDRVSRRLGFRAVFHRRNVAAAITIPVTTVNVQENSRRSITSPAMIRSPHTGRPHSRRGPRPLLRRGGKRAECQNRWLQLGICTLLFRDRQNVTSRIKGLSPV